MWETWVRSPGWEDPLEKEMASHSSTLAWKIPWTEEPGKSTGVGCHCSEETWIQSLGQEDPLEKEIATHFSILAWEISWTEEPEGLQSMGSQTIGLD